MAVSSYVIAAICGCFKRESGVNPGIWESRIVPPDPVPWYHVYQYNNIGGYGFGQFTNTSGPGGGGFRCGDYYNWCVSNNLRPEDGNAQLQYIFSVENVWYNSSQQIGSYTTLAEYVASTSTNLHDLVWDFLASWEGVPGDAFAERYAFAQRAFDYIEQHKNDTPSDYTWVTGNFYTSDAQMLNNVMCVYFYMDGYSPGVFPGNISDFVQWCIATCNDPNVGYSQQYREEQTVSGITYYDCSSFVWYGLAHTGFDIEATGHSNYAFNTLAMPTDLPKMGFVQIDKNSALQPGDIGVNSGHTEVVYQGGTGQATFMGAHSDRLPLADQVSIDNYTTPVTRYESIWRFMSGPGPVPPSPTPVETKKMPIWMYLKRLPF